ncbi:MAG: PEP-utilizing enzyme [Microcoleaceae cyanobacterium]
MGKPNLKNTLPSLIGLLRLALKEIGLVKSFQRDNQKTFQPELEQLTRQNISKLSLQELLNRAEHIQNVLKPITYYNILGPIGLEIRKTLFKIPPEWLPNEALPEVASMQALQKIADQLHQTVAAQTEISSETLAQEFSSNSSIQQQLTTWLSNYSYMSEVGTDISVATWGEQPENFQQTLLRMAESSPLTREKFDAQSLNWQERWRLQQCTQRTVTKGQISEIYGKLLADLRWTILAIEAEALKAGALQQSGDIFFLEYSEVKHWIQTGISDGLQQQVQHRRQQFAEDSHRPVPTVVYGNILPEPQTLSNQMQASMLTGIPASVGQVEGIVKVCRSFTEAPSGSEKFILVVPYTDAGWAPLLLNAKAVLAEVGGQLSHGAIIAREYGIPAVMNIENVTTRLQDGQQVRVNGYRGTVEVLS